MSSKHTMVFSQEKFINYEDFELAYSNNPNLENLSNRFDLLFILLLDDTNKSLFFDYDLSLNESYDNYIKGLNLNKSTVGFVTQKKEIIEIFNSEILWRKVLNCISSVESTQIVKKTINYPIYVKDNTAIIEIFTGSSILNTYYFRLNDGVVQINWLGRIIETPAF